MLLDYFERISRFDNHRATAIEHELTRISMFNPKV